MIKEKRLTKKEDKINLLEVEIEVFETPIRILVIKERKKKKDVKNKVK